MRRFHCPDCERLLFKGFFADVEIKCKCGELVRLKVYTASSLLLTSSVSDDMIATVTDPCEGLDSDCDD